MVPECSLDVTAVLHTHFTPVMIQLFFAQLQILFLLIQLTDFKFTCSIDHSRFYFSLLAQICSHQVFDDHEFLICCLVVVAGHDKTLFLANLTNVVVQLTIKHIFIWKILCIAMVYVALAIVNKSQAIGVTFELHFVIFSVVNVLSISQAINGVDQEFKVLSIVVRLLLGVLEEL